MVYSTYIKVYKYIIQLVRVVFLLPGYGYIYIFYILYVIIIYHIKHNYIIHKHIHCFIDIFFQQNNNITICHTVHDQSTFRPLAILAVSQIWVPFDALNNKSIKIGEKIIPIPL